MIKRESAIKYEQQGAQGDVYFRKVGEIPEGFAVVKGKEHVLAHSETGHNHVVDASGVIYYEGRDPLRAYLQLQDVDSVDVHHQKHQDFHHSVSLGGGPGAIWEVRRQREYDPAGERRAAD